ncbi:MAG: 50S ribosomal protein L37ae [Candidatus Micrarchaeota archaeon]
MRTPKFGRKIRKLYEKAEESRKKRYECPRCGKRSVKRVSYALWECRSCGARIAGAAYSLSSEGGETARRVLSEEKERGE